MGSFLARIELVAQAWLIAALGLSMARKVESKIVTCDSSTKIAAPLSHERNPHIRILMIERAPFFLADLVECMATRPDGRERRLG
jgi:hypothetical protein